ncbi:unnamed protein product [Parnassius apollo]|uniref:(apollo) hypothetical protein n=1 Tax=Parnassius apollo TaxID=110799 RepID=A0A8S3WDH7_PARAO|nr:unnamed protein product [Parnassius apollo]
MLRPGYRPPIRKTIGDRLLNQIYMEEKKISDTKLNGKYVCMSVNGWSNVHNDPIICVSLTTNTGEVYLYESIDTSGSPHTADYLTDLASNLIKKCKNDHECQEEQGKQLILPQDVDWNTFTDCLESYLAAWPKLIKICEENKGNIDRVVAQKVSNIIIKRSAEDMLQISKPISVALDRLQASYAILSDTVQCFKELEATFGSNGASAEQINALKMRKNQAITPAHLLAFLIDPIKNNHKLTTEERVSAMDFALKFNQNIGLIQLIIKYEARSELFIEFMFTEEILKNVSFSIMTSRKLLPLLIARMLLEEEDFSASEELSDSETEDNLEVNAVESDNQTEESSGSSDDEVVQEQISLALMDDVLEPQTGQKLMNRRDFMKKVHSQLVLFEPWLKIRLEIRTMPTHIKNKIKNILGSGHDEGQGQSQPQPSNDLQITEAPNSRKRKICSLCSYTKRRMTFIMR